MLVVVPWTVFVAVPRALIWGDYYYTTGKGFFTVMGYKVLEKIRVRVV